MVLHSIVAKSKKKSRESTKMNTSSEIIVLDSIQSPKGQVISKELFGRIENTKDCFRDLQNNKRPNLDNAIKCGLISESIIIRTYRFSQIVPVLGLRCKGLQV